jgi:hypothetical protein
VSRRSLRLRAGNGEYKPSHSLFPTVTLLLYFWPFDTKPDIIACTHKHTYLYACVRACVRACVCVCDVRYANPECIFPQLISFITLSGFHLILHNLQSFNFSTKNKEYYLH